MTETAPTTDAEWDYLCTKRAALRLRTLSNRLYQQERQRMMETREGLVKAASLLSGSVALASIAQKEVIQFAVAIITVGTVLSLVFGWGNKARDAAKRATEWANLDRDIEAQGERTFTEEMLGAWFARCNEIEATEPAQNAVLFEKSSRRACEALRHTPSEGGPSGWRWRIPVVIP